MLGVLLCLFAQATALSHFAFARHGICPEHGELTDLEEIAPSALPAPDQAPAVGLLARSSACAVSVPRTATLNGVEDHCALTQLLRQVSPAHAASIRLPPSLLSAGPVTSASAVALEARVLDVAPKQSPPV